MATTAKKKVPVSERALLARINRHLAKEGEHIHKTRGTRWFSDLGNYYTVDISGNYVTAKFDSIYQVADCYSEWNVIRPWEEVGA